MLNSTWPFSKKLWFWNVVCSDMLHNAGNTVYLSLNIIIIIIIINFSLKLRRIAQAYPC